MGEGNENLVYSSPWDFKSSLTCRKILHGTFHLYFPSDRKVCCGFSSPLKLHRLVRVQAATFGSSGKHTNHYITKATCFMLYSHTNSKSKVATTPHTSFYFSICKSQLAQSVIISVKTMSARTFLTAFFLVNFIHENVHSEPVVCVPSVQLHVS
jgi:hypothetical protein